MDPDLFITLVFGSLVALFGAGGAVLIRREHRRGGFADGDDEPR
jgi:hypothetical protein